MNAHLLDCTVAVLSLGLLCDENGYSYTWRPQETPFLSKGNDRIMCYPNHNVPFIYSGIKSQRSLAPAGSDSVPESKDDTNPEMPELGYSSDEDDHPSPAGGDPKPKKARKPRCSG